MTAKELRKAHRQFLSAQERADGKRRERNRCVREALADGWSHAEVAKVLELSRGRIGQMKD